MTEWSQRHGLVDSHLWLASHDQPPRFIAGWMDEDILAADDHIPLSAKVGFDAIGCRVMVVRGFARIVAGRRRAVNDYEPAFRT